MDIWISSAFLLVLVAVVEGVCNGGTCNECVAADPSCSWCSQEGFKKSKCQTFSNLLADGCDFNSIQNPTSTTSKLQDEKVRDSDQRNRAIQLQPQRIKITTRPRKKETFSMTFRAADNFPVDLYFLFDNSKSMSKHIQSLANLARDIGGSIGDISSNFRMGYGVFQDKVILPFTDTTPARMANPCITTPKSCSPPFEYRHILHMTEYPLKFETAVNDTELTGNLDRPEGSLDAILQAVTCTAEVGWRSQSRKLLIFGSNDRFHIAGDGKLAGIVFPNDGKCHLDREGRYNMEREQDYPSVSQITEIVGKHQVHIIFTVTYDQMDLFKELSRRIPQSTVELLALSGTGNRDIKQIIEKKYKEMISEVSMKHSPVEGVDITIKAKSAACERQDTNVCKGLEIGKSVEFDVDVRVTSCPTSGQTVKIVEIYPDSLREDKLVLEIETKCECDCAQDDSTWELASPLCSDGNGTLICGQCSCNAGRFGETCECDASDTNSRQFDCKKPGDNSTGPACNGAGRCECGKCYCDEGFSGDFCECNDRNCGSFQRELCGGSRGRCLCGVCECESEYTGPTCGCSLSNTTCLAVDGTLCSNNGNCDCGECMCDEGYVGLYCQNCVLCGVCDNPDYRSCAECLVDITESDGKDYTGYLTEGECSDSCPDMEKELVESLEGVSGLGQCSVKLSDGCFLDFRIQSSSSSSNITIQVMNKKKCPSEVNMTPVIVGVVVGIVMLGILLLALWKLATWIIDSREYSKFTEDLAQGRWAQNDNPFYKGATTTYRNPMMDPQDPSLDS